MKIISLTIATLITLNCFSQKSDTIKTVRLKSDKVYTYNTDTLRWALDALEFNGATIRGKGIYYGGSDKQALEAFEYLRLRHKYYGIGKSKN